MAATRTPRTINSHIRRLCARLGIGWKPQYLPVIARADSGFLDCFSDVARQVAEHGGAIVCGWQLWEFPRILVEAEFHAVWRRPNGALVDVQHKLDGEREILFVEDRTRTFTGVRVDNVRLAVGKDPLIAEFIAGNEEFQRVFNERHGGKPPGLVKLEPDLARMYKALELTQVELIRRYPSEG